MIIANHRYTVPRIAVTRSMVGALLGALAVCVFFITVALLEREPVTTLDHGRGLYLEEFDPTSFRWTGSQAEFAIAPHTGPTRLTIVLRFASWPERTDMPVWFETDTGRLGELVVTSRYHYVQLLLPPGASFVRLHSALARPPGDWRWLGVQVRSIEVTPSGLPSRTIAIALLFAVVSIPLAWGFAWAIRHGYGPIATVTLAGLILRLLWLDSSPPLIHRDEAVSLVDAWHLAHTGHDHLGHRLPIAAFEAYGDWISPLLTYLLLPWIALFGPQPLIARIVTAVFGALAIPIIYGFVSEFRRPVAAICAALVAALSPWQIFLSRVAIPPALVATTWVLCLWAAVRFIRLGRRRDGIWLAVAAGLAVYAYPTMKMAVPLLVALAAVLALTRHGWRAMTRWWLPALALAILWLPLAASTLFNPASSARLELLVIKANSLSEWLATWLRNYTIYFQPKFYYYTGGIRKIIQAVPKHGMANGAESILLLGLAALPILAIAQLWRKRAGGQAAAMPGAVVPFQIWLLLLGAVVIAPLPANLMASNPNTFRASPLAPLYAILVGVGAAAEWQLLGLLPRLARSLARGLAAAALVGLIAWQCISWFTELIATYPALANSTWFFADGEIETMRRVAAYAPQYDEVLVDATSIGRPYIYLLAAEAVPPAEAQAQIVVERQPPQINGVDQLGRYRFADFVSLRVPDNLPALEALPTSNGMPGYLIQEWQRDARRILVVRGMPIRNQPDPDSGGQSDDTGS